MLLASLLLIPIMQMIGLATFLDWAKDIAIASWRRRGSHAKNQRCHSEDSGILRVAINS
jgi:hypothetical protein